MSEFMDKFVEEEQIPEDEEKLLRQMATAILAGLDQARSHVGLKMGDVPWKRMGELADRLAIETVDYSKYEGLLVGVWMAASARAQFERDQEESD